jgi:hypothetical protein
MKQLNYFITLTFALFYIGNTQLHAENWETVTAVPSNDFLNSIGVNTSINSRGENITQTLACAEYMGFRWIRAGVPGGSNLIDHYQWLYDMGIRFSIGLGNVNNIQTVISGAKTMINDLGADAIIAFEGCNEPNSWGVEYNGEQGGNWNGVQKDWQVVGRYHRDFYAALKADPVLGTAGYNYPVWSLSYGGACPAQWNIGIQYLQVPGNDTRVIEEFRGVTYADVATCHNYFIHGNPRINNQTWKAAAPTSEALPVDGLYLSFGNTWLGHHIGYSEVELENLPRITTETGTPINGEITENMQGLMYLSCYLAQYKRDFKYTSMYILRDRTDEGGNQSFGFYAPAPAGSRDYVPRLSAHYLHNMTTVLSDKVSTQNPKQLTYAITPSRPETVHELLLQKENGTLMLIVWGEKYQPATTADNIEVKFDKTFNKINVYDPVQYDASDPGKGTRPVATYENVSSIPLSMLRSPYIIEIDPVATAINETLVEKNIASVFVRDNNLLINSAAGLKKVEIYDLAGKKVLSQTPVTTGVSHFDIGFLPKGCYIIQVTSAKNQIETHKIVK